MNSGRLRSIVQCALMCVPASLLSPVDAALAQSVTGAASVDGTRGVLTYAALVEPALASVVRISSLRPKPSNPNLERFLGQGDSEPGSSSQVGSGFIVDAAEGLILTAAYIVDGATRLRVQLDDGLEVDGAVVGFDRLSDVGLLRVKANDLRAVTFGDAHSVQPGDLVFAAGFASILGKTVTAGIVSGFAPGVEQFDYRDAIVTDVGLPFGFGGGPLLDSRGRVIGIASSIYAAQSHSPISIAISETEVRRALADLRAFGHVQRASLGVTLLDDSTDPNPGDGVQLELQKVAIDEIAPGSAAEKSGLQKGDVIVQAAGRPVRRAADLIVVVRRLRPGNTLDLVYERDGMERPLTVTLDQAAVGDTPPMAVAPEDVDP